jgi:hypothetical protein
MPSETTSERWKAQNENDYYGFFSAEIVGLQLETQIW